MDVHIIVKNLLYKIVNISYKMNMKIKRIISFAVIFLVCGFGMYAFDFGFINLSYLGEFQKDAAFHNICIGAELVKEVSDNSDSDKSSLHLLGLNYRYRFKENDNILNLYYLGTLKFEPDWVFGTFGFGSNISYNFNKNIFGIGPYVSLIMFFLFFKEEIIYRYNIIFSANNSHEIEVRIGVVFAL
jgi:hypothetical protein